MESAAWTAPLAFIFWFPFTFWLLHRFPGERGICYAMVFGWLFLPFYTLQGTAFTHIEKPTIVGISLLLGCLMFNPKPLYHTRLRWFDLPVVAACLFPIVSSVLNDLGIRDGLVNCGINIVNWASFYWVGRCYLATTPGCREIVRAMVVGTLVYLPFMIVEMRLSPHMNLWVYGYEQHSFDQAVRFGGYRPLVFVSNGLDLATYVSCATVVAFWLWRARFAAIIWNIKPGLLMIGLVLLTIMCRSVNGVVLMAVGIAPTLISLRGMRAFLLMVLLSVVPFYVVTRLTGTVDFYAVSEYIQNATNANRAQSFTFRLHNEDLLMGKALERKWFGWAGWGRSRVYTLEGKDMTVTDGMWIIYLGVGGLAGLMANTLVTLVPVSRFWWLFRRENWLNLDIAPIASLACIIILVGINNLMNATSIPLVLAAHGAIVAVRRTDAVTDEVPAKTNDIPPESLPVTRFI